MKAIAERAPVMLVLALAIASMDLLRVWPLFMEVPGALVILAGVFAVTSQSLLECMLVVAAITLAEQTRFGASHRVAASVLAVLMSAPLATALGTWLTSQRAGLDWVMKNETGLLSLYLYIMWYSLMTGLLAIAYFITQERAQRSASELRQAQIERQGLKQRMVESRLNVMKARVDPDFLFRMIGDVQRLYRSNVDAAEQRLEDFIEYLRAALPRARGGATTLGEEVRLATAYVRLHEESFDGRLEATFDVDESLADAQFPPMALLPLVDDALRRAGAGSLVLRTTARSSGDGLTVEVIDDCGNAAQTPALASHERAFVQFFGEGARVIRVPGRVRLEIDHAIPARAHR
jgi:hypothetical protein